MATRRYCKVCGIVTTRKTCHKCGASTVSSKDIKRFPRGPLTTPLAAKSVGISLVTLQRWIAAKKVQAPALQIVDGRAVRLWFAEDLRQLIKNKDKIYKQGKGRPRKKP